MLQVYSSRNTRCAFAHCFDLLFYFKLQNPNAWPYPMLLFCCSTRGSFLRPSISFYARATLSETSHVEHVLACPGRHPLALLRRFHSGLNPAPVLIFAHFHMLRLPRSACTRQAGCRTLRATSGASTSHQQHLECSVLPSTITSTITITITITIIAASSRNPTTPPTRSQVPALHPSSRSCARLRWLP
jgi:hypothetical protein